MRKISSYFRVSLVNTKVVKHEKAKINEIDLFWHQKSVLLEEAEINTVYVPLCASQPLYASRQSNSVDGISILQMRKGYAGRVNILSAVWNLNQNHFTLLHYVTLPH